MTKRTLGFILIAAATWGTPAAPQVAPRNTSSQPFEAFVLQGRSPAAFATLLQALQSNQVGLQSGDCSVDPIAVDSSPRAAGLPAPASDQLIWYGRHGRMNSIAIGDSFTVECTAAFPLPPPL